MTYASLSVAELLDRLGAATPAPASGSAAALAGALAAGLAELAAGVSGEAGAARRARALRARLTGLADEDAEAYVAFMATRSDEARSRTVDVPLEIAEASAEVAMLGGRLAKEGKQSVAGDSLAAAELGRAAVRVASMLVELNLAGADDPRAARAAALRTGLPPA